MIYNNPYILSDQISGIFKGTCKKSYTIATIIFEYF